MGKAIFEAPWRRNGALPVETVWWLYAPWVQVCLVKIWFTSGADAIRNSSRLLYYWGTGSEPYFYQRYLDPNRLRRKCAVPAVPVYLNGSEKWFLIPISYLNTRRTSFLKHRGTGTAAHFWGKRFDCSIKYEPWV